MTTWLKEGELYGKPTVAAGCETVCGVEQKWSIGITGDIEKPIRNLSKRTEVKATPYQNQLVLQMIPFDSSGGTCTSNWSETANPFSHKMQVTMSHWKNNRRIVKDLEYVLTGGESSQIYIPITDYGSYIFEFKTLEWGEDCNKPTGTDKYTIIVKEKTNNNNSNPPINPPVIIEPLTDDTEEIKPMSPAIIPIAMIMGIGIILAVSSAMNEKN